MKFCSFCDNMLYVDIDQEKNLVYYCKNCNNKVVQQKEAGSIVIVEDNKINDELKFSQYINKYLKYDPTLPRVSNMSCPNASCTRKDHEENEVIYIKYDPNDMKYVYYCCHCDYSWINQ